MKMNKKFTMLQTANVHVYKFMLTNANRILRMMHNPETPYETRDALRSALQRIMDCTDMDKRLSLNRPENVAELLRVGVVYQEGEVWQSAHKAHSELWTAFNEWDRVENPRAWVKFDAVMRADRERCARAKKPRASRAERRVIAPPGSHSPVVHQLAA